MTWRVRVLFLKMGTSLRGRHTGCPGPVRRVAARREEKAEWCAEEDGDCEDAVVAGAEGVFALFGTKLCICV